MDTNWLQRTELLLGKEAIEKLKSKHVLVVGLGGVGAYAAEMIARAGVGRMTIVDGDVINVTNINRQLPALNSQVGRPKAEIMAERIRDINPHIQLEVINAFVRDEFMVELLNKPYDYVVDAIDTLSPKVFLIYHSIQKGHKIVSSMGAGGKIDPTQLHISDISKSYNCKLAKAIRKRLHRMGIKSGFPVVFSTEEANPDAIVEVEDEMNKKSMVGTISYMPALFGIFCASKVIRDLVEVK